MKKLSVNEKNQAVVIIARQLMNALRQDVYPTQSSEAVFGIKMEKINLQNVQNMSIGAIVYNVWMGLFKNQIVNQKWLENALLSGDLPKRFEKSVYQLMQQASKKGCFTGSYMPELIRRGFDKIIWDTNLHNVVKLN